MSNRKAEDTFARCPNTDVRGVCMYAGPCMTCTWNRAAHEASQRESAAAAPTFEKELRDLINRHSKENESNTPDFILAGYIAAALDAFTTAVQQRETWYGRDARPSPPTVG